MPAKRVTKKERELARLTERLVDIGWGVLGCDWSSAEEFPPTVEQIRDLQIAVRDRLLAGDVPEPLEDVFDKSWCVGKWADATELAAILHEHGVRP